MKFLKEKKGIIISFIIGVIVASSITVYAYSYRASDISYTKPGAETAINVSEALNELYTRNNYTIVDLGTGTTEETKTFDVKNIEGWENFTVDNFLMKYASMHLRRSGSVSCVDNTLDLNYNLISYNSTTGIVTIGANSDLNYGVCYYMQYHLICVY